MHKHKVAYLYVFAKVGNGALINQCIATTAGQLKEKIKRVLKETEKNKQNIFWRVYI